ncbi:hypothetical protein ACCT05_10680 [Rhizobium ruizarguesonis]
MYSISFVMQRIAVLIFIFFLTHTASIACPIPQRCDQYWVAAQDVGVPLSFFSVIHPQRDAALLEVGDRLLATTKMNVRRRPGDFTSPIIGTMKSGVSVLVQDVKLLSTAKGPQIWLRVRVAETSIQFNEEAGQPVLSANAQKVISCYRQLSYAGKTATVLGMYECSGTWVTPRALLLCSIGAACATIDDTIEGRAIFDSFLKQYTLTKDSALSLDAKLIPRVPNKDTIERCRSESTNGEAFTTCVTRSMSQSFDAVFECSKKFTEGEKLACLATQTQDSAFKSLVGCLAGGKPSPDKVLACATDPAIVEKADDIRRCVADATNSNARDCLLTQLGDEEQVVAKCLLGSKSSVDVPSCFSGVSPEFQRLNTISNCVREADNNADKTNCLVSNLGGDAAMLATCVNKNGEAIDVAVCALGGSKEAQIAQKMLRCAKAGRDAASILANCSEGVLDEKSRQTVGCVVGAGGDKARLAACAAGTVLPPDAARLVGCATSSQGPTSFALCAAGPSMNEEWRIAAECAVQSGGNPVGFAGCTAGRLTVRELTKCFTGEIGKDCFGPNNTIVKTLNNAYSDLTKGPGQNNEIVKAIEAVGDITGGPNSVINNPGQIWGGDNSVFNNPQQILGGDNSVFNNPSQLDPRNWRF